MSEGLQEDALHVLSASGAVREVVVGRSNLRWHVSIRLSGGASRMLPVRSRREPVRTWASLSAVGKYLERLNLLDFRVEL